MDQLKDVEVDHGGDRVHDRLEGLRVAGPARELERGGGALVSAGIATGDQWVRRQARPGHHLRGGADPKAAPKLRR